MSSPMVNKDTLYFFPHHGEVILAFYYGRIDCEEQGWSRKFRSFKTKGWEWRQKAPFEGDPIGQRCILQWQNQ